VMLKGDFAFVFYSISGCKHVFHVLERFWVWWAKKIGGHCKALAPAWEKLSERFGAKAIIGKVDCDKYKTSLCEGKKGTGSVSRCVAETKSFCFCFVFS
jgi:hypothetical protein